MGASLFVGTRLLMGYYRETKRKTSIFGRPLERDSPICQVTLNWWFGLVGFEPLAFVEGSVVVDNQIWVCRCFKALFGGFKGKPKGKPSFLSFGVCPETRLTHGVVGMVLWVPVI